MSVQETVLAEANYRKLQMSVQETVLAEVNDRKL